MLRKHALVPNGVRKLLVVIELVIDLEAVRWVSDTIIRSYFGSKTAAVGKVNRYSRSRLRLSRTTEIHIDDDKMTDVLWCSCDDVRAAVRDKYSQLCSPVSIAIAHHLIKASELKAKDAWSHLGRQLALCSANSYNGPHLRKEGLRCQI